MQATPQQTGTQTATGFLAFDRTATILAELLTLQAETLGSKARLEERLRPMPPDNGGSMSHPADVSYVDMTVDRATLAIHEETLKAVERAKTKVLVERTYGLCDDCHEPIEEERLAAHPEVIRCCPCRQKFDAEHAVNPRRRRH